jgi:hypothetical protein
LMLPSMFRRYGLHPIMACTPYQSLLSRIFSCPSCCGPTMDSSDEILREIHRRCDEITYWLQVW